MAERTEATLGMSSLDRLRELKEETERRQAGGRRRVVDLPIAEVHPDPRQVRSDFVADVLSAEDQEDLEGLARNIAAIGIHNPIHVRPDAEGGYVIISGERRWRAAGIAGLETVPCLVAAEGELDAGRNTLTQLSENLQRSNLKLLDVAHALKRCLDETGLGQAELAKELGKSKSWVSKYLALLKAEGRSARRSTRVSSAIRRRRGCSGGLTTRSSRSSCDVLGRRTCRSATPKWRSSIAGKCGIHFRSPVPKAQLLLTPSGSPIPTPRLWQKRSTRSA